MTTITTDTVTVTVQGITGEIEAKIDTGAHQTSMHADEIQVSGDSVIFKLNDRTYRAPLETEQDVSSSDGGTQSRPVIRSTIIIAGQSVETLINLNDRTDMPQKVLIGQDVIRSAGLTLQLSPESQGEDDGVEASANTDSQLSGTPTIYQPVDEPESTTPTTHAAVDTELTKRVLKLMAGVNAIQQDLMDIVNHINERGTASNE